MNALIKVQPNTPKCCGLYMSLNSGQEEGSWSEVHFICINCFSTKIIDLKKIKVIHH